MPGASTTSMGMSGNGSKTGTAPMMWTLPPIRKGPRQAGTGSTVAVAGGPSLGTADHRTETSTHPTHAWLVSAFVCSVKRASSHGVVRLYGRALAAQTGLSLSLAFAYDFVSTPSCCAPQGAAFLDFNNTSASPQSHSIVVKAILGYYFVR